MNLDGLQHPRLHAASTTVVRQRLPPRAGERAAEDEVLTSLDVLYALAEHRAPERLVRVFRPAPTLAFSRRESLHPGFAAAERAARNAGYEPIIRPAGGRAVALDADWIVLDIVTIEPQRLDNRDVFVEHGEEFVALLRGWGVDARFGPVPGEYCPGDYSVNARGRVKLVGTAQRVARGVRLYSASLPLRVSDGAAEMLSRVNALLELDWDPTTLGSLAEEIDMTDTAVEDALLSRFAGPDIVERTLEAILRGV